MGAARERQPQHHPDRRRRVGDVLRRPLAIEGKDQVGQVGGEKWRFGRSYIGSPERLIEELGADQAIAAADTLLVTIPNQLGVDFNLRSLAAIKQIGEALGWDRADVAVGASA